jgi:hypothetical protein
MPGFLYGNQSCTTQPFRPTIPICGDILGKGDIQAQCPGSLGHNRQSESRLRGHSKGQPSARPSVKAVEFFTRYYPTLFPRSEARLAAAARGAHKNGTVHFGL